MGNGRSIPLLPHRRVERSVRPRQIRQQRRPRRKRQSRLRRRHRHRLGIDPVGRNDLRGRRPKRFGTTSPRLVRRREFSGWIFRHLGSFLSASVDFADFVLSVLGHCRSGGDGSGGEERQVGGDRFGFDVVFGGQLDSGVIRWNFGDVGASDGCGVGDGKCQGDEQRGRGMCEIGGAASRFYPRESDFVGDGDADVAACEIGVGCHGIVFRHG
mmetsp:Transcript_8787/g.18755  ORF Transcript_8787/g.18755 Transcript_8787/m.18755 type:complete len:213 (-) Transcript_8787:1433-2071(-)